MFFIKTGVFPAFSVPIINLLYFKKMDALNKIEKDSYMNDLLAATRGLDRAQKELLIRKFYQEFHDRVVPPLDTFIYDKKYLGLPKHLIYPKIFDVLAIIDDPTVREVYICAGKGSGKSVVVALSQVRMLYRVLSYVNPAAFFKVLPGTYLAIISMSINASQAVNVIFKRFREYLYQIKEFQKVSKRMFVKYRETVDDPDYKLKGWVGHDSDANVENYSEVVNALTFPDKSIAVLSGHSRFQAFFGYDIIFGSLDEWSMFNSAKDYKKFDKDSLSKAEEMYQGLKSQAFSRFPDHYKFVGISSPWSQIGDPVFSRYEEIKNKGFRIDI